jgi:hypothetical protein
MYPTFLDASANAPELDAAHTVRATRVLEAFRSGARAQIADLSRYRDLTVVASLPDSLRKCVTLKAEPAVQHDSGFVDVFSELVLMEPGPVEMAMYRYFFVRREGAWHFVRRVLTYAT